MVSIPGMGRSPGEGNGDPLQYSCLENHVGSGVWQAAVHGGHKELDTTEQLNNKSSYMLSTGNLLSIWGLYSPWNSLGQNTGMLRSCSFLQEIFPTHESNPDLPQCMWVLYQLSHQGSPNTRTGRVKNKSMVKLTAMAVWQDCQPHQKQT